LAQNEEPGGIGCEARSGGYIFEMAETFKCPHCGAVYEIRHEKAVSEDNRLAARNGSDIRHYELVKMPDGTNV
jgi:Fe2+ or Zn2+ uptake regulation protein